MPKIRIGLSTDFNLVGEQVGIGTTNPTSRIDVAGQILADNTAGSGGISTFKEYQGFHKTQSNVTNNILIDSDDYGAFSSLSGEIRITGETIVSSGSTVEVGKTKTLTITDKFAVPSGGTNTRDNTPEAGTTRFNQDFGTLEFFDGANWKTVNSYARYQGGAAGRGVFPPGLTPATSELLDYITISSLGNAIYFGDLTHERRNCAACSSSTRGIIGGGYGGSTSNEILYITLASGGNAHDFGTLVQAESGFAAAASSTRGLFAGATGPSGRVDYIEIGTLGNAIEFGDLTTDRAEQGALSSPTRMVIGGGGNPSGTAPSNVMDYVTISSKGNATDFGDLVDRCGQLGAGFGNFTRGIFAGGLRNPVSLNVIQYITIASTGNAIVFGHLKEGRAEQAGAASNSTRGVVAGGSPTTNTIEYVTISSPGNAQDFGDLAAPRQRLGGGQMSDSHGGLGGF
jgi:hypothetical protein